MPALIDTLQNPTKRQAVIDDAVRVIDSQVRSRRGASGMVIKSGYKVVSKLRGGQMIPVAVSALIDDFARALEPLEERFDASTESDLPRFLSANSDDAANALLSVTDRRIGGASGVIQKTYGKLRPMAERQVVDALPEIGALVQRHR